MDALNTKIPTVLSAEELADKVFKRAAKISKNGSDALDTRKKTALARVTAAGDVASATLYGYVQKFPRIEKSEDFFPELVDVIVGIDRYKKALGALNWAAGRADMLKNQALGEIRRTKDPGRIEAVRKGFYGRLGSYMEQVAPDLLFLQETRNKFRQLPYIDPGVPTAVIAGFPNVGKSSLVTYISTADPQIAPYPFTTKGITVGHIEDGWRKYQIVDTPGLLDRDFEERNDIEKQAVLALRYLTDVMVFMLDPSETCGYEMGRQERLLANITANFPGVPMVVVESKKDVLDRDNGTPSVSAATGAGMEEFRDSLVARLREVSERRAREGGAGEAARWWPRSRPATR